MSVWRRAIGDRALAAARRRADGRPGIMITSCVTWLLYAIAYPRQGARLTRLKFRLWTALPGDVFEDFQANLHLVVTDVKPDAVQAVEVSNELLSDPGYTGRRRPGCRVHATKVWYWRRERPLTIERSLARATLPRPERAARARHLVELVDDWGPEEPRPRPRARDDIARAVRA